MTSPSNIPSELTPRQLIMIGRVYFLAVIPFFGAVVGPWMTGHFGAGETPVFVLWSFTVVLFTASAFYGVQLATGAQHHNIFLLLCLLFASLGLGSAIMVDGGGTQRLLAVMILLAVHWLNLWAMQKQAIWQAIAESWRKQHVRFVWVVLACHMLVLLNLIYAAKQPVA